MMRSVLDAMEATWPPVRRWRQGPWRMRDGGGGGSRVSAATLEGAYDSAPPPFVQLTDAEAALDADLAARGYTLDDVVAIYVSPMADLPSAPCAAAWPPAPEALATWAAGGKIGAGRRTVMERAGVPKAVIWVPGAAAFVGVAGDLAVLHALEVVAEHRRKGLARQVVAGAVAWSAAQGATRFGLVVSADNRPARALYDALGMTCIGFYRYRKAPA
ncbi:GNAT family N-acetyltransferase [Falsirhodobacter halotolerans]|uniref:GNAT family N-acetyltransferase n=1 Tax=Falsirhodobacter halotolerans TaxID=1146892 RepID=UPI001FD4EDD4|nr:GNAT family N-acetyltransferase [Falsirhodobacter halotolerans]MCJ8140655.1 GNAT family N-acetyltransferase [Falsirhodobacter halotolerans]